MKTFAGTNGAMAPANPNKLHYFEEFGYNRYLFMGGALEGMYMGMETGSDMTENLWNGDPNSFENAGRGFGTLAGTGVEMFYAAKMGWDIHRKVGGIDAFQRGGRTFTKTATEGAWHIREGQGAGGVVSGHRAKVLQSAMVKGKQNTGIRNFFSRGGLKKGFWKNNKFHKNPSMLKDIGGMIIGGIVAGFVGQEAAGMAGRVLDWSLADARSKKGLWYDNRMFGPNPYAHSSYQQVGLAMQNYNNTSMSNARIFHHR